MVILPEFCNSPNGNDAFYAESIPGDSTAVYSQAAQDNKVFLVAGSIPERKDGKLYNTSTVFNPEGSLIAKFSKVFHIDVDIPGGITFQESKTITAGDNLVTFDTPYCKVGLGVCYDIRFPELAKLYVDRGCQLLIFPTFFSVTTGSAHFELLTRARAADNQLYVATVSPARDETTSVVAWGYSCVADPWGEVIAKAGHEEAIVYGDIDPDFVKKIRSQMPLTKQRRADMYTVMDLSNN
ncbi:hypothetical protein NP493_711g02038 [Ridgeia piscesae]|uniref:omega-amidase n=1 Tax=Ridgeia piscesae TaxID=27915 RepID=A0AAD9NPD3_RIDPI|nr:hypothetical protein NP493_711g02038 [Ridgeia piscesae]